MAYSLVKSIRFPIPLWDHLTRKASRQDASAADVLRRLVQQDADREANEETIAKAAP